MTKFEKEGTGIPDITGKEICEGDILKGWERTRVVRFRNGGFKLMKNDTNYYIELRKWHCKKAEIAGSVYDSTRT